MDLEEQHLEFRKFGIERHVKDKHRLLAMLAVLLLMEFRWKNMTLFFFAEVKLVKTLLKKPPDIKMLPPSEALKRVKEFLPSLQDANKGLLRKLERTSQAELDIENIKDCSGPIIEMVNTSSLKQTHLEVSMTSFSSVEYCKGLLLAVCSHS